MAQGPLEISGILKDGEKEKALSHFILFFPLSKGWGKNLPPQFRNSLSHQLVTANFPLYQMYLIPERGSALPCCSSHKKGSFSLKSKKLKELESAVNITNSILCCLSKFTFWKCALCCLGVADGCKAQWGFIAAINSVVAAGVKFWNQWLGHEITLRYFVMTWVCRSCMCWSQYHYWILPNECHLFIKFKQNISSTEHDPFRYLCNTGATLMNPCNSSKRPIFRGKSCNVAMQN